MFVDAIEFSNGQPVSFSAAVARRVTDERAAAELDHRPISGLTGREMLLVRSAVRKRDQKLIEMITDEERIACRKFAARRANSQDAADVA
ncbi:MAG: hypothetical protein DLM53_08260 [Candidatus Eremiobacter antarcticus]|nr:hypothetical protein [Candidatus Eremiobacteraeota bacterium]PZR61780.1 MAG: hypothetical protein DLM53_08260 [Candidatus Eremiobacter sp. RRmetagenome_bin22]